MNYRVLTIILTAIASLVFSEAFCQQIGADYYTEDGASAANKAEEVLKAKA